MFSTGYPEHQFEGRYRLSPGDTYVEAGAFWGRYGLVASHRVGPSGRVVLIEPNPYNHKIIEDMVEHYSLTNVTLEKCGVWSTNDVLPFVFHGNPAGGRKATLKDKENYPDDVVDVSVHSLDSLLPELGIDTVNLLACDVEGAEFEMVRGCWKLLEAKKILNTALGAYHALEMPELVMHELKMHGYEVEYHHNLAHYGGLVYGRPIS
jgi:FkbM family methyltransferase